jgi:hypothetical protein
MSDPRFESVVNRTDVPDAGTAEVTIESVPVTEKEIKADRDMIIVRLDGCYNNLTESMTDFQSQWDDSPTYASITALKDGALSGASGWADDAGDIFDGDTWSDIGDAVGDFATNTYDMTADYAANTYEDLKGSVNETAKEAAELVDNADDTLLNWKWWVGQSAELGLDITNSVQEGLIELKKDASALITSTKELADDAQKIYQHRKAILDLPNDMALGNVNKVEHFVDTILMDIDRKLAEDIKNNPNYASSLQLIEDHDSILSYMAYFSLTMEAIPPNFYIYIGAKGGAYLALELILMFIIAILSAGTAVAARVAMIIARFATAGAKASKAVKKAQQAIQAFIRIFEDFILKATKELHALGKKLVLARSKGARVAGSTGTKMTLRKEQIRRDRGRCRMCKKTTHKTPTYKLGTIEYE